MIGSRFTTHIPKFRRYLEIITAAIVILAIINVVDDWPGAFRQILTIPVKYLLISILSLLLSGLCSMMSWKSVFPRTAALNREWSHCFYMGQLGKYAPGAVWIVIIQARMAKDLKVKYKTLVGGFLAAFVISILCASFVAMPIVGYYLGHTPGAIFSVSALLGCSAVVPLFRHSRMMTKMELDFCQVDVLRSVLWSLTGWCLAGFHLSALLTSFGVSLACSLLWGPSILAAAVSLGSLMVITPGGLGVRELIMLSSLVMFVSSSNAASILVVSRLSYLLTDFLLAGFTSSKIVCFRKDSNNV